MTILLGQLLVGERIITETQLAQAIAVQKAEGGRLGEILVQTGILDADVLERFFQSTPPVPRKLSQTGLSGVFLLELMLKIAHFEAGVFTLAGMARSICLATAVVDELIDQAKADRLIGIRAATGMVGGGHVYELTDAGRQRAEAALVQSQYAGPAPVTIRDYSLMVAHQSIRQIEVDEQWVRAALNHMVLSNGMVDQLGPAINSGRSIFLYGPPGTGKSSLAEAMSRALPGEVYVPQAIEVDGQVIRLYDPETHVLSRDGQAVEGPQLDLDASLRHDPRWMLCKRPMVMVGGELEMHALDLDYDPVSKYYEAPIHMSAIAASICAWCSGATWRWPAAPRNKAD
jgi:hypothetical protein